MTTGRAWPSPSPAALLHPPEDPFSDDGYQEFNRHDFLEPNALWSAGLHDVSPTRTSPGPAVDAIRAAMMTARP
jgi:hypothetical protein